MQESDAYSGLNSGISGGGMDQEMPWELPVLRLRKAEVTLRHDLQYLVGQKEPFLHFWKGLHGCLDLPHLVLDRRY